MTSAIVPTTDLKNTILDATGDSVDDGSSAGQLTICVGATVAATLEFSDPAWNPASGGTKSLNAVTNDSSAAGNASPVDTARFNKVTTAVLTEMWNTDCGITGAGVNLSTLTIGAGDIVAISSGTLSI